MNTVDSYDCQECGACCSDDEGSKGYVSLDKADIKRLPKRVRRLHVVPSDDDGYSVASLATKNTSNGVVCSMLLGSIGLGVKCGIYKQRPRACRVFKAGDQDCHIARSEFGLPLMPDVPAWISGWDGGKNAG